MRLFPLNHGEGSGGTAPRRGLLLPVVRRFAAAGFALPAIPRRGQRADFLFRGAALVFALAVLGLGAAIVLVLATASTEAWSTIGASFFTQREWLPARSEFGALPLIQGTLATAGIALLIAVPVSLGIAIFLSELAPSWIRSPVSVIVELLAAIPSVVYGLWGFFVLAPFLYANAYPRLQSNWGWTGLFGGPASQLSVMTAGILLSIMIIPTISSLSREVLRAVPLSQREAAYALGATRWEVIRLSVLPYGRTGLFGAAVLGLARAIGETMAVVLVIGNSASIFGSLLSPGSTIPSTLANEVNEASGLHLSALFALGLILFAVTLVINMGARLLIRRATRRFEGASA